MGQHPYIIVLKGVFVSNPVLVHWSRYFKTTSSDWFEWVEWRMDASIQYVLKRVLKVFM